MTLRRSPENSDSNDGLRDEVREGSAADAGAINATARDAVDPAGSPTDPSGSSSEVSDGPAVKQASPASGETRVRQFRFRRAVGWAFWTLLTSIPLVSCLVWLIAAGAVRRRYYVMSALYLLWPGIGLIISYIYGGLIFDDVRGLEGWFDGVAMHDCHALVMAWIWIVMWLASIVHAQLEWMSWSKSRQADTENRGHATLARIGDDALPASRPYWICLVFWLTLGWAGGHRFYTGRWISGVLYLGTLGMFGAGWAADVFFLRRMLLTAPRLNGFEPVVHLAPWAEEHTSGWLDFMARLAFFLLAPFVFVGFCVYFQHLELLAVLVLVVVVCGLLGNLERIIGRLHVLERVPMTRPAVSFLHDLYKYYYETHPRSFAQYLFWPITLPWGLWNSPDVRKETALYAKFLLTLYILIVVKEVQHFATHYHYMSPLAISLWFAFHLAFATIVTATFIIPIVTTSFKFNLAGDQTRLRLLSVIILATTLPIAAYTYYTLNHRKTPTPVSWLMLQSRNASPAFRADLQWEAEIFLRHYWGRVPHPSLESWSSKHRKLTKLFRFQVNSVVEASEARALEVRVVRSADPHPTLAIVECWKLGPWQETRTLFAMSAGEFYSSWERMPPRAKSLFAAIESTEVGVEKAYKVAHYSVAYDEQVYDISMGCLFDAPDELELTKGLDVVTYQPELSADLRRRLMAEGIENADEFRVFGWDDGRNTWHCIRDAQHLWMLSNNDGELVQMWDEPALEGEVSRRRENLKRLEFYDPIESLDLTHESDRMLARDLVREHTHVFLTDAAQWRTREDSVISLTLAYREFIEDLVPSRQRDRFEVVEVSATGLLGVEYDHVPLFAADAAGHFYARGGIHAGKTPLVAAEFLNRR